MNITFKLDDAGLKSAIESGVRPIIKNIAFNIEALMKQLMTLPKHGRRYKRGSRFHIASAPGEAPAVDTGNLINTIKTEIKSDTEATITIPAAYAEALEFGSSKIAARPFVRPAIEGVIARFNSGGGFLARATE